MLYQAEFILILIGCRKRMSRFSKDKSYDVQSNKGKNLILVSNSSADMFSDLGYALPRASSRGGEYNRTNSISNLFQNFQPQVQDRLQPIHREEPLTQDQRYAKECLQYQKSQFDDKIRLIIHRMAILAYHSVRERDDHPFLAFSIERFLCNIAKKLMLNRFELLFLEYVLEESKWRYDLEPIPECVNTFKTCLHVPEAQNPHGTVRHLEIYLLFCAYYSKKSLNDLANEGSFHFFLNKVSPDFKERYQEWSEKAGVMRIRINPKNLNIIFRKLTAFGDRQREYLQSYNLLVEEILDISPAYNSGADGKAKKGRPKRERVVRQEPAQEEQFHLNSESNPKEIQQDFPQEDSPLPNLGMPKKQTSYASNIDGLDPIAYYNRTNH